MSTSENAHAILLDVLAVVGFWGLPLGYAISFMTAKDHALARRWFIGSGLSGTICFAAIIGLMPWPTHIKVIATCLISMAVGLTTLSFVTAVERRSERERPKENQAGPVDSGFPLYRIVDGKPERIDRPFALGSSKVEPYTSPKRPYTLKALFEADFPLLMKQASIYTVTLKQTIDGAHSTREIACPIKVCYDLTAANKFLAFYVPADLDSYTVCNFLATQAKELANFKWDTRVISSTISSQPENIHDYPFSGRVFIYTDAPFTFRQKADMIDLYHSKGLNLEIRGNEYLSIRSATDK